MKSTLRPGIRATHTFTLTAGQTVPALYPSAADFQTMPEVFATGFMVGLMEWACMEVIKPHLDEGEGSLGVHVAFSHVAASLPGQTITVEAECTAVDGRRISFKASAHDGIDRISEGTHQRLVVSWERFKAGVNAKAARAAVPELPK